MFPINLVLGYNIGLYFGLPDTKILFPVLFIHYVLQKLSRVNAYKKFLQINYIISLVMMSITLLNIILFMINRSSIFDYFTRNEVEFVHMVNQTYAFFLGIAALLISVKEVKRYKQIAVNEYSDMDLLSLNWLWRFVMLLVPAVILWGAELIRIYIGFYTGEFTDWDFVAINYFALTIFIYVVSYQAFRRNDLFELSHDQTVIDVPVNVSEVQIDKGLQEDLEMVMIKEMLFLKNDLTINDVAKTVSSSPKKVSTCLNAGINSNFSEWVNRYRVDEVKKRIDNPEYDYLTIEAIGQESGFKSRSAMYTAFKKFTGESPAKLRKASLS